VRHLFKPITTVRLCGIRALMKLSGGRAPGWGVCDNHSTCEGKFRYLSWQHRIPSSHSVIARRAWQVRQCFININAAVKSKIAFHDLFASVAQGRLTSKKLK